jgi:hypothetical protein
MLSAFSEAVLCELLTRENRASTAKMARHWQRKYPANPKQAAIELGLTLHKEFRQDHCVMKDFTTVFMSLAMGRVDWTSVAQVVLERFAPPVGKGDCLHVFVPRSPSVT